MNVIWSPLAIERLAEITDYIAQDNPSAAEKWVQNIFKRVEHLQRFPEIGRLVPELSRPDIREILFKNYRIIYRIESQQLSILTIRHGKQLLSGDDLRQS